MHLVVIAAFRIAHQLKESQDVVLTFLEVKNFSASCVKKLGILLTIEETFMEVVQLSRLPSR